MGASINGVGSIVVASVDSVSTDLQINADVQTSGLLNQIDESKIKIAMEEFIDEYLSSVEAD